MRTTMCELTTPDCDPALEQQATKLALGLHVDTVLTQTIDHLINADSNLTAPWLLCYKAMACRFRGEYDTALTCAQTAAAQFVRLGRRDGHARALAEVAIVRYHLGQFTSALAELAACPTPDDPICAAALWFAAYLNRMGLDMLADAINAAQQGLNALEHEPDPDRLRPWRIVLQRNLAAAYHFQGDGRAARQAAEEAVSLAEVCSHESYLYDWSLYELGVVEQRAGRLDVALAILQEVRARIERVATRTPLWRWTLVAQAHTLRDLGRLDEAAECFQCAGWGEGDEGPLMLWLLQGRRVEARCAVEAYMRAAHASPAPAVVTNLTVLLALLDFEEQATPHIRATLQTAAAHYAALGFEHSRASVLFHLAAVEYALGDASAGDQALAEALRFGATRGYLNVAWWHPARMRGLLQHAIERGIESEYSERLVRRRGLEAPQIPRTLKINCFGHFEVWVDDQRVPVERWHGHKAGAVRMQRMLLYLARRRKPQPMHSIAHYVWPDIWEAIDVSRNFHLTLAALRRVFEPNLEYGHASQFVRTTPQGYQLNPELRVSVDLDLFHDSLCYARDADAYGDHDAARDYFTQAEQRYSGDFALAKPDPGEVEEYRQGFLEALCWLAADDLRRGAPESCIARARRVLHEDYLDNIAPALLIQAYLAAGNQRAARRQRERYVQLHGETSPAIQQLVRTHRL
jgi:DNA-binding SARP family transcriptional activator